jgi:hypothetical protein
MQPNEQPSPSAAATTDAVFQQGSPVAAAPATAGPAPAAPPGVEELAAADSTILLVPPPPSEGQRPADAAPPHLGDYVRELGQEYQEQQDQGRL